MQELEMKSLLCEAISKISFFCCLLFSVVAFCLQAIGFSEPEVCYQLLQHYKESFYFYMLYRLYRYSLCSVILSSILKISDIMINKCVEFFDICNGNSTTLKFAMDYGTCICCSKKEMLNNINFHWNTVLILFKTLICMELVIEFF